MSPEFRLRIGYKKQGRGAYLSHLEVIRALERTVRRAQLPYAITQGFSPHMKVAFGPALGVGTASRAEYFDVIVTEFINPDQALNRLQVVASDVLVPFACGYVSSREPSLSAAVNILQYQVIVEGDVDIKTDIPEHFEIEQRGKIKAYDALNVLPEPISVTQVDDIAIVRFTIRATPQGTLRPDSLMKFLMDEGDGVVEGVRITYERTATLIEQAGGTWVEPLSS